jgi:hypothetical protein
LNIHANKNPDQKSQSAANQASQQQNDVESAVPFIDNRPEAILQRRIQTIATNHSSSLPLQLTSLISSDRHPIQMEKGLSYGDKVLVELYGDEEGEIKGAEEEFYYVLIPKLKEVVSVHKTKVRKVGSKDSLQGEKPMFRDSIPDKKKEAPQEQDFKGGVQVTHSSGDMTVNITQQLINDYKEDMKEIGTWSSELEASLLASKWDIKFNIYTADAQNNLHLALRVNGGAPENRLLHTGNHFVVLEQDNNNGIYQEGENKYTLSALATRSDGSCLLDACYIVKYKKKSEDKHIIQIRKWLVQNVSDEQIAMLLEPLLFDIHSGIDVPGLGSRMSDYKRENKPEQAEFEGEEGILEEAKAPSVHKASIQGTVNSLKPLEEISEKGSKSVEVLVKTDSKRIKVTGNTVRGAIEKQHQVKLANLQHDDLKQEGIYTIELTSNSKELQKATLIVHVSAAGTKIDESPPINIKIGTEFTFTNDALTKAPQEEVEKIQQQDPTAEVSADTMIATDANRNMQKRWLEKMKKGGERFTDLIKVAVIPISKGIDAYRAYYSDGWWYQVSLDVSCLELQTCPMSLAYASGDKQEKRMQTDIFGVAKELRLKTHKDVGGGHIHIGLEGTFDSSDVDAEDLLFRDFIVDLSNHPHAMEIFDNDPINAPVLGQHGGDVKKQFARVIGEFDAKKIEGDTAMDRILLLASRIRNEVYTEEFREPASGKAPKYQAINVERITRSVEAEDRTVEIRNLRAQRSADELVKIATFFQARIDFLRKQRKETGKGPEVKIPDREHGMSEERKVLTEFQAMVEESGLQFSDYQDMANANLKERK